jgi:NitT/TauT family transport system ATP-binding protein
MAIVIEKLTKSYGPKLALTPFSLTMAEGETLCLLGQSGCGKTTLLRLLLGLETPTGGTVTGLPERISAVFQEDRLCPAFSAVANVSLALGRQAPREEIPALLSKLGLGDALNKPVRALSGGMQRRVAIARSLLYPADLYLMDEPFKGLDEDTRRQVMDQVLSRTRDKTLLVVTHDPEEAAYLGGRIVRM